jgi:hypothetical protein
MRLSPSPRRLAPGGERIDAAVVLDEGPGVHDGDHGVDPRHVAEASAILGAEVEGGRHGHRLAHPGALDQQRVEPPFAGELGHLYDEVLAQRAADAPVGHLDQLLLGAGQPADALHQGRVDVDLAHVVDDDGDPLAFPVREHVVEQGRLARAQEAREHGDGQAAVHVVERHQKTPGWSMQRRIRDRLPGGRCDTGGERCRTRGAASGKRGPLKTPTCMRGIRWACPPGSSHSVPGPA